jgi:hypothetical protein
VRDRRKDLNHHDVADEFERHGWIVEDVTAINCFCDIHVSYPDKRGLWSWVEIKNGNKKLTKGEIKFRDKCYLIKSPYHVCRSIKDVAIIINNLERISHHDL